MSDEGSRRKERIAGIFGRAASNYDRIGPRFFSYFGRRLVELAEIPRGANVLDVGSGRGSTLFPAAEKVDPNGHVIGFDLSIEMVCETFAEILISGLKNVELQQMDAEQLSFANASFDFVLCGFSIFFFPKLQRALKEFFRVLRPGGRVGISTFAKDEGKKFKWIAEIIRSYLPRQDSKGCEKKEIEQVVFNTPNGVTDIFIKAGFENIKVIKEKMDRVYANEEEWWAQQWSHGARGILERIAPENMERLKSDIFRRLQDYKRRDGIHIPISALFTFGTRP
jgi:ubiquinone/menaquinone biosynthesis C-methylase UbiE